MTTRVIVSIPANQQHAVVVRSALPGGGPFEAATRYVVKPGEVKECLIWKELALHIEEIP